MNSDNMALEPGFFEAFPVLEEQRLGGDPLGQTHEDGRGIEKVTFIILRL